MQLAQGGMLSLQIDRLPLLTAAGFHELLENVRLSNVSITNCSGWNDFCRPHAFHPGLTVRIISHLPPSVKTLHLTGCNVHPIDLPKLQTRDWELDIYQCEQCGDTASLPCKRACSRCTVVACGWRLSIYSHEWRKGCSSHVACDTCGELYCEDCATILETCEVQWESVSGQCTFQRCAACLATSGADTVEQCEGCLRMACGACLQHGACAKCDRSLCESCITHCNETCPRCERSLCIACLMSEENWVDPCEICGEVQCNTCDPMRHGCSVCNQTIRVGGKNGDSACRGCIPSCCECGVPLCDSCVDSTGQRCRGGARNEARCSKIFCADCYAPSWQERHESEEARGEPLVPTRWAALERLDLPRPKRCASCDDAFCHECSEMRACSMCGAEECERCATETCPHCRPPLCSECEVVAFRGLGRGGESVRGCNACFGTSELSASCDEGDARRAQGADIVI